MREKRGRGEKRERAKEGREEVERRREKNQKLFLS